MNLYSLYTALNLRKSVTKAKKHLPLCEPKTIFRNNIYVFTKNDENDKNDKNDKNDNNDNNNNNDKK